MWINWRDQIKNDKEIKRVQNKNISINDIAILKVI